MKEKTVILGAGITGLSAGFASGLPVYEAAEAPGGICSSYYVRPGEKERLFETPADADAYRFEIGGGHWIFGGDPGVLHFIKRFTDLKAYERRSSVFFIDQNQFVPYPLQNHLRFIDRERAAQAINEMNGAGIECRTMKEWLTYSFGPTLCQMFFFPFHDLYTAGLYDRIAPQDAYKSPVDLKQVIQGALSETTPVGYNAIFVYPTEGLNTFAQRLAEHCDIRYGKRAVQIDLPKKRLVFEDGERLVYDKLISTLPLNKTIQMTGVPSPVENDPFSSVLVLNIGAVRGDRCPIDHWLYITESNAGFHRVGFYSNVDASFLPISDRKNSNRVSIYVERAYPGGCKPTAAELDAYTKAVVKELQHWRFIREVEVADPTWIEVAYTWSWPESNWKQWTLSELEKHAIYQVGRYGRWSFNGIAASIRDGLIIGSAHKFGSADRPPLSRGTSRS